MAGSHGRSVEFCEKSTIAEAWAVVYGLPGPIDETDAPVLARSARVAIPGLEQKPAVVAVNVPQDHAPPFWSQQFTWDGGRHLARFGHRYLSVHFVRQEEERRYTTYGQSLLPALAAWLTLYREGIGQSAEGHPVDRVGFGYTNGFELPAADFDVSRYFRLNVAIDIGSNDAGLLTLTSAFRFYDTARGVHLTVSLTAEGPPMDAGNVSVKTKVLAECRATEGLSYADSEGILRQVNAVKDAAKSAFFGFVTDATCDLMGARYAADDP